MDESKASPRPWFRFPTVLCVGGPFDGGPGQETAGIAMFGMRLRSREECEANIDLTLRAVNAHDALVAFVERVKGRLREVSNGTDLGMGEAADLWNAAIDVLKLAGES